MQTRESRRELGPIRRLWLIAAHYDTEPVELAVALATAVRGLWFLLVPTVEIPGLVYLREAWGFSAAAAVLGTGWVIALAYGARPSQRAFFAIASATLRTYLAVVLAVTTPAAVNVPYNGSLAVISAWLYARLLSQPRASWTATSRPS
jgi:hypothetical protein